jgi:hypothetical protein
VEHLAVNDLPPMTSAAASSPHVYGRTAGTLHPYLLVST